MVVATREVVDEAAEAWGAAPQAAIAETAADLYDELVRRLPVEHGGEDWVDVATGTGPLALRAARAGASVTAIDIAEPLLEIGRTAAAAEGLAVLFDQRRAERHGYVPDTIQVVTSAFGAMYSVDHETTAAQMATIVRPAGRIGLLSWTPDSWNAAAHELTDEYLGGARWRAGPSPFAWGVEGYVVELFGEAFSLELEVVDVPLVRPSGLDIWRLYLEHDGPTRSTHDALDPTARERFAQDFVDLAERYREVDGIHLPRPALLVTGRRR
jgi:SAM-dependent methyltransferase